MKRFIALAAVAGLFVGCHQQPSDGGGMGSESDATRGSDFQDRAFRGNTNLPGDSGSFGGDTNIPGGVQRSPGDHGGTAAPIGVPDDTRSGARP